jgi:hypothetical protein
VTTFSGEGRMLSAKAAVPKQFATLKQAFVSAV